MKPSCSVSRDGGITLDGDPAAIDGDPADNNWHCPHTNLANNLFASSCDNRRPTISFGTRFSVFTTTSRDADMAGDEPAPAGAGRLDKGNKLVSSRKVRKHK
jgi:hypothetical protein